MLARTMRASGASKRSMPKVGYQQGEEANGKTERNSMIAILHAESPENIVFQSSNVFMKQNRLLLHVLKQ